MRLHVRSDPFLPRDICTWIAAALSAGIWEPALAGAKLPNVTKGPFSIKDEPTPYTSVTTYNNFYEFSTDKEEPPIWPPVSNPGHGV